jgi:hypothetical protein
MSNNKQSSVEWLVNKLADLTFNYIAGFVTKQEYDTQCNKVIEQAKAMHKEEMERFFKGGMSLVEGRLWKPVDMFEEYYNETFGGNNE